MSKNLSIFVENEKRLNEYLDTQLKKEDDLTEIVDQKVKNFLSKYENLLTSTKIEDINKFYEETGLIVTHLIKTKQDRAFKLYLDSMGLFSMYDTENILPSVDGGYKKNFEEKTYKVCNHHLLVVSTMDKLLEENNKIYSILEKSKKCIFELNKEYKDFKKSLCDRETKYRNIRHKFLYSDNAKEKINIIKKELKEDFLNYVSEDEIQQIECIYPFNNFLILLKDGTLYLDSKIYTHNVREICVINSYESYIIYKDNMVEPFTFNGCFHLGINKNKKVINENGFFATLGTDNRLVLTTVFENMGDELTHLYFDNVDNIEYDDKKNNLIMEKNNEQIMLSTYPLLMFYK